MNTETEKFIDDMELTDIFIDNTSKMCYNIVRCEYSLMAELQLPKLIAWVRFPLFAPKRRADFSQPGVFYVILSHET